IEAGQLVAGDATIDEAVINRIWTDGIAARTIDVNKLTVASRNMWPDPGFKDAGTYEDDGWEVVERDGELGIERYGDSALRGGYGHDDPLYFMPVVYGEWYDISAHLDYLEGSTGDTYIRARSYTASGSYVGGSTYSPVRGTPSDDGKTVSGDWTPYSRDTEYLIIGFFTESNMPDTTRVRWTDFRVRPKVGTVLIEDGAITTPKLTVTEDMSAAIVNAMSVNTKKLVVTEEAILNHATLIGQTVVDDINVQGKLIGTDGVFTGTVDFENVNVTGTQIVNKLGANSISASQIKGGSFSGETFTGGRFQGGEFQAPAAPRWNGGIAIDPTNGLRAWNSSGAQTLQIDPTNGDLRMMAGGGYFTGSDRDG